MPLAVSIGRVTPVAGGRLSASGWLASGRQHLDGFLLFQRRPDGLRRMIFIRTFFIRVVFHPDVFRPDGLLANELPPNQAAVR